MAQIHGVQHGTFHVTTNTRGKVPWCTYEGIPQILIDNLVMTRNVLKAELYAFCILPDHMHMLLNPGEKGLSAFMHSFKRNVMRDIRKYSPSKQEPLLPVAEDRILRAKTEGHPRTRERYGSSATVNDVKDIAWQKSFHDERIRDSEQRSTAFHYIQGNGMKHELVTDISDWPWTSLHFPNLLDPMEIWID